MAHVRRVGLAVDWLIETHAHADHVSASPYFQDGIGGKIGIGENIKVVQEIVGEIFNQGTEFRRDGSQFDRLFRGGDIYTIGGIPAFAMATPGHTPVCMAHVIGNAAFMGDTLFMPDGGTARADFPGGGARELYCSIKKSLSLPARCGSSSATTTGRTAAHPLGNHGWRRTLQQRPCARRHQRGRLRGAAPSARQDAEPKLIIPSIQINIRAGELPEPDASGKRFLKVPINEL